MNQKIFIKFLLLLNTWCYDFQLKNIYHHGVVEPDFARMDFSPDELHAEQAANGLEITLPVSGQKIFQTNSAPIYLPDLNNMTNLISFAKMAYNAYSTRDKEDWYNFTGRWDVERPLGSDKEGVQGYVFTNHDSSTLILAYKGTSAAIVSGDSPTSANDKLNDNRMFSCCCARVDPTWYTVCDCYKGSNTCRNLCVEKAMDQKDMYFDTAQKIMFAVLDQYPTAKNIWLTGHSLGGGLASLLGLAFGLPAVTFQSPGDSLAAQRLHLPVPDESVWHELPIWHYGHTADPIFMGKCNGALSSCYIAGYALETGCHIGNTCIYDTVKDLNWGMDIRRHRLGVVIEEVLNHYNITPECKPQRNCTDCSTWSYLEEN